MVRVETYPALPEAAAALGSDGRFLAGGTLVMRDVNYGRAGAARLIRVTGAERKIQPEGGAVLIGAQVTMAQIIASPDAAFLAPAARAIGGPAIRNMATIGGNLFAPHPYGDFATALLALGAEVVWSDGRTEPLERFLAGRDSTRGLVAAIRAPRPANGTFRFRKVSRVKPKGISVMCIAAHLPMQGGRLEEVRLAFGAMGPTPLRATAAERALAGATLDEAGVAAALQVVTDGLSPPDDALASTWYRREVAPVHLKRLLLEGGS